MNKKNRAEKKPGRDQQEHVGKNGIQNSEPEQRQQELKKDESLLSRENLEKEVIRHFEETEGTRKIIADLAKGNNSDMEKWIQTFTQLTGLDDEQRKTEANGIKRAVESRRNGTEKGKRVCFVEKATEEAQEAREWQEKFTRGWEARAEESREQ